MPSLLKVQFNLKFVNKQRHFKRSLKIRNQELKLCKMDLFYQMSYLFKQTLVALLIQGYLEIM